MTSTVQLVTPTRLSPVPSQTYKRPMQRLRSRAVSKYLSQPVAAQHPCWCLHSVRLGSTARFQAHPCKLILMLPAGRHSLRRKRQSSRTGAAQQASTNAPTCSGSVATSSVSLSASPQPLPAVPVSQCLRSGQSKCLRSRAVSMYLSQPVAAHVSLPVSP